MAKISEKDKIFLAIILAAIIIGGFLYLALKPQDQQAIEPSKEVKDRDGGGQEFAAWQIFYIKPEVANMRKCPSLACEIIVQYPQNAVFELPYTSVAEMPEWVRVSFEDESGQETIGYMNKVVFSPEQVFSSVPVDEKEASIESSKADSSEISAEDLSLYLSGVVEVECFGDFIVSRGSGSLWEFIDSYAVVTNAHVKEGDTCYVWVEGGPWGRYKLSSVGTAWNTKTDVAVLEIVSIDPGMRELSSPIPDLNYAISDLPKCSPEMPIGSQVVIIGYPAFGAISVQRREGGIARSSNRLVTNGIISGHEGVQSVLKGLPHVDYFTSAKIDAGNSGGVALSKENGNICLLGIPTWLSEGVYETQGIIQNIHNVLYTE